MGSDVCTCSDLPRSLWLNVLLPAEGSRAKSESTPPSARAGCQTYGLGDKTCSPGASLAGGTDLEKMTALSST